MKKIFFLFIILGLTLNLYAGQDILTGFEEKDLPVLNEQLRKLNKLYDAFTAPANATYITKTANSTLSAEQALGALSTGIMKVTTTTGVVSSLGDPLPVANGGTGATAAANAANGVCILDAGAKVATANLGSGSASASNYLRGDQSWQTISTAVLKYSGANVYYAAAPTSFTDLNLSSIVGANRALVMLLVRTYDTGTPTYNFRRNGDTDIIGGCWNFSLAATGQGSYLFVETDSSGIIEWTATQNTSTNITVLTYLTP